MSTLTELEARRCAWTALSELFLDTEVNIPSIITCLQQSHFNWAEIETIMECEVAPVVGSNVFSIAGEWRGFNLTAIQARYLAGTARPSLTGRAALHVIREDWKQVQAALRESP